MTRSIVDRVGHREQANASFTWEQRLSSQVAGRVLARVSAQVNARLGERSYLSSK